MRPDALPFVLTGPTGTGKSAIAAELAERLGGIVVCADSRQLYRGLDVATGKPTNEERARAPHRGFDVLDPGETSSAGAYVRATRPILEASAKAEQPVVLAGGTGLYLRALHQGLAEIPPIPEEIRARVRERVASEGPEASHAELAALDPALAERLSPRDGQRVARGLEVVLATGRALSDWQSAGEQATAPWLWVAITRPRAEHQVTLERRARAFFDAGLVEEVEGLLARGVAKDAPGLDALGYREAAAVLDGTLAREDAVLQLVRHTAQYAKRQLTWLRGEARRIELVYREVGPHESPGQVARDLAARWEQSASRLGVRRAPALAARLSS